MLLQNLPINSDVPLVAPADSCCNCGATSALEPVQTDLRHTPYMGMAGAEIKIVLPFPYCESCAVTAKRRRPSALGVIAVSSLLALVLGMCWIFFGPQLTEQQTTYLVGPVLVVSSFLIVLGFYSLRRPTGAQSSYYQPVRLKKTGHKWPVDITGLELGFTNAGYAEKFSKANLPAIEAKKLKVSRA